MLADEPTGNLDERTADKVLGQFLELVRGHGSAALVATHNERLARTDGPGGAACTTGCWLRLWTDLIGLRRTLVDHLRPDRLRRA